MWWRSCSTPVAIEVAHTGVTEGKAAQSSGTKEPRSRTAAIAGASPRCTARSSMEGLHPSMTARSRRFMRSAQDAQPGVLLVAAAAAGDQQRDQEADGDERQRRKEDARARDDEACRLPVEGQRRRGLAVAGAGKARTDAAEDRT